MSADGPPPTVPATTHELRSPSSFLVRAAAGVSAAILVLIFAVLIYWETPASGRDFHAPLPPLAVAALNTVWTLGAAVLLLTRTGAVAAPLPRWLLRVGPWVLAAFFGMFALLHLVSTARGPSGDWQIDMQGPLLLLLAGLCIIVASEKR